MKRLLDRKRIRPQDSVGDSQASNQEAPKSTQESQPGPKRSLSSFEKYQPPPGPPPTVHNKAPQPANAEPNYGPGPPAQSLPMQSAPAVVALQGEQHRQRGPHMQSVGNNLGMEAGMMTSLANGGSNFEGDMLGGQMIGNFIGQRVGQAQRRNEALEYREQMAAGIIQPGDAALLDDGTKEGKSAAKRAARWERRAARRDKR